MELLHAYVKIQADTYFSFALGGSLYPGLWNEVALFY